MIDPNAGAFAAANQDGAQTGLTKREYFAAMAMQGLMTISGYSADQIAGLAVQQADALIEALGAEK